MIRIKHITLIIFLLIISNQSFSQLSYEFNSEAFGEIIVACRDAESKESHENEIDKDEYYKYFEEERNDEMIVNVSAKALLKYSTNVTVMVELGHPMGGYTSTIQLATFDRNEKIVQKKNIGFNAMEGAGGCYSVFEFYENELLEIKEIEVKYSGEEGDVENILNEKLTYYLIDDFGFKKLTTKVSDGRKFNLVSNRVLSIEELGKYSKEELDVMRNEIFADNGYIFKTAKWSSYFKSQDWYKPNSEFSEKSLNAIEKYNIKNIIEIEK